MEDMLSLVYLYLWVSEIWNQDWIKPGHQRIIHMSYVPLTHQIVLLNYTLVVGLCLHPMYKK